ncbi:MAG: hypothetical protein E7620_08120 [Ruminococcaceae bacterium]|nr:hypothetical protein [Oscillospiraceae bacterium]
MKRMKQLLSIFLVLVTVLTSLASCIELVPQTSVETTLPADTNEAPEDDFGKGYELITIAEALELCGETGNITTERYYIRATIVSIDNAQYGKMTIQDATGTISVYGTYSADGAINYSEMSEKPYKGDEVILHCILQNYNGTKEVKNARLIDFRTVKEEVDLSAYTDMTVAEAREAAVGTKIRVSGVVARITYANGMIPSGVYLMDETQTVYIYDGDLAQRVAIGNQITVCASKTYWILDAEKGNAEKFGYQGCCQLESATLVENDEKTDNKLPLEKLPTSTVKAIMETPVTENITTATYKVTALVKKVPGSGFTNYYFYDLDGETGAYTYTQCNGKDFAWLDAFDGKICTVYLSAINAKSTSTDCFFRFLPVAVYDEGFKFDLNDTAKHVVEYYGMSEILSSYSGDPALELTTKVSSELLGFENAILTYTSDNTAAVYFTEADGKLVMHCGKAGTATVTVSCSYNGKTYSQTLTVKVEGAVSYNSITIAEAIAKSVGEKVILKGIVGPSLVNRSGFYLFDETGMIAVIVPADQFEGLKLGHEIILEAKRDCFKDADKTHAGQTCVSDGKILTNFYGNHDYPTDRFITDKTAEDFYNLDVNVDHSTSVYVIKATVQFEETAYYTSVKLVSGSTKLTLYCSSGSQYSFLKQFNGQEVTLEIAPCNWNNKTFYAGCVLAVRMSDGSKVINTLNFVA